MANPYQAENGVFFNKLGITDAETLRSVEYFLASTKAKMVLSGEIAIHAGKYGLMRLKEIHKVLFDDLYEWEGQERTTPVAKFNRLGKTVTHFISPNNIRDAFNHIEKHSNGFRPSSLTVCLGRAQFRQQQPTHNPPSAQ
ncbi:MULTISPECIES: hypothetical protein [Neisseria]|uniref:Cell filamentation protein Fic n=1 Tax=Neisseria musculi TaxID=1815583 RepID=A0A7H1MBT8_9NEIS|nr:MULTISPECIES: hypothetical protein [Neisseria]MBF0804870.1 hypothetical protein [Neisseria sp. 19428wB4_WF04]QNT59103.1 hypothetical protein H7A79_2656 [Neisseria musculi]TFU39422.1 hypothetical protein E4T99_11205 [Neisseria sp. WF04]